MRRFGGGVLKNRFEAGAIEFAIRERDSAKSGDGRKPIGAGGHLPANLAFGKASGEAGNAGDTNPALQQAEFGASIRTGVAPAKIAAFLGAVSLVTEKNDQRFLAQLQRVELRDDPADRIVEVGNPGCVGAARFGKMGVAFAEFVA